MPTTTFCPERCALQPSYQFAPRLLRCIENIYVYMQVPAGGAGWYLLGRISRLTGSSKRAAECYVRALRLEPMLWVAFAELCMLGEYSERCGRASHQTAAAQHGFVALSVLFKLLSSGRTLVTLRRCSCFRKCTQY